jgi:hypothetical protein
MYVCVRESVLMSVYLCGCHVCVYVRMYVCDLAYMYTRHHTGDMTAFIRILEPSCMHDKNYASDTVDFLRCEGCV